MEYDIDFSKTNNGVNGNIYTISPHNLPASGYDKSHYCDGAKTGADWCVEVDWIESNGHCGGQSTLHVHQGPGTGCTAWGCANSYHYNGKASFHMKVSFGTDGKWTVQRDGQTIHPTDFNPAVPTGDWGILEDAYKNQGAVIYSSQWVGWVPLSDCGTSGDLASSSFSINNLKIVGSVKQGPQPRKC